VVVAHLDEQDRLLFPGPACKDCRNGSVQLSAVSKKKKGGGFLSKPEVLFSPSLKKPTRIAGATCQENLIS